MDETNEVEVALLVRDLLGHAAWLASADVAIGLTAAAPVASAPAAVRPVRPAALMDAPPAPVARPRPAFLDAKPAVPAPTAAAAAAASAKTSLPVKSLSEVRSELGDCTRCKLSRTRTNIVFGAGNPNAELVFVGEAPGEEEDKQGEPFVGRAGELLTKMIEAMGYARETVYIANIIKCRPPNNRNPEPDELAACEPFLLGQLGALRPKVIVALGKFAAQTLLRDDTAISRLRGTWRDYQGVKLMPTFHPAYLLRSPQEKGKAWDDLKLVMRELGKGATK